MEIAGFKKFTLADYPAKRSAVLYFKGCNYRCPFCFNSYLVSEEEIKKHVSFPLRSFLSFLNKSDLEGVSLDGGEPTLQKSLPKLCRKIKRKGFFLKLNTNGSNPEMLKELIAEKLIDYAALDIKSSRRKYPKAVGFKDCSKSYLLAKIDESIDILKKSDIDYQFQTTLVPKLVNKKDIQRIVKWIGPAEKYVLRNFQNKEVMSREFSKVKPYSQKFLYSLKTIAEPFFKSVEIY